MAVNSVNKKGKKVLVALSGGVDSSVAAALLKRARLPSGKAGYSVEGAYMQCWSSGPYCSTEEDRADAARVAAHLGIPFHVFNFEKEYRVEVIDHFFAEYKAGRTPNPDVMCNKEIKFGLFLKEAEKLGFDYIATGHYSKVVRDQSLGQYHLLAGLDPTKDQSLGQYHLLAGLDPTKDQSYFLYTLTQDQLAKVLFPIGDFKKSEVRKLAKKLGLPTANKKDSMGICFIGPADIKEFLMQEIKPRMGNVINLKGELLGKHMGLPFYTIGQREGLGVSARVPYYVVEKDGKTNTLVVVPIGDKALFRDKFVATDAHWVGGEEPKYPVKLNIKLRYRAQSVRASINKIGKNTLEVTLESPQRAITPGQSAVFYRDLRPLRPGSLRDLRPLRPGSLRDLRSLRSGGLGDLRPRRPGSLRDLRPRRPLGLNGEEVVGGALIDYVTH